MYKKGDIIKCQVTGYKDFGIFVKIDQNFTGLIHISEISDNFVKNISDYINLNEFIYAKIIDIDWPNNRLSLSIKNVNYKLDNKGLLENNDNGFIPLKKELNIWINDKNKENNSINDK